MLELDLTHYPVVIARTRGAISDADLDRFLADVGAALDEREGRFVFVNSVGPVERTTKAQNERIKKWYLGYRDQIMSRCAGMAFAMPKMSYRLFTRAALAKLTLPYPCTIVSNEAAALTWSRERAAPQTW